MAEMDGVADYNRQDRGIQAQNLFIVAPPLLETTLDRPDPRKQPTRGALMPSVLTEVGSITHRAEQDLLASEPGQAAAAQGIFDALQELFTERALGAAYQLPALEPTPGTLPVAEPGAGPMFWAPVAPAGPLAVRLTNTGTDPWPADLTLLGGSEESDQPYLRVAPDALEPLLDEALPAMAPGRIGRRGGEPARRRFDGAPCGVDHARARQSSVDRNGHSAIAGGKRSWRLTPAQQGCYHLACQISNR